MFKFLKNKIKEAVNKFSKSAKEEQVEEEIETEQFVEEQPVETPQEESSSNKEGEVSDEDDLADDSDETPKDDIAEDLDEDNSVEETIENTTEDVDVLEESPEEPITQTEDDTEQTQDEEPEVIEMTEPVVEETSVEEQAEDVPEELQELAQDETEVPLEEEKQEAEKLDELFVDEDAEVEPQELVESKEESQPADLDEPEQEDVVPEPIEDISEDTSEPVEEPIDSTQDDVPEEPVKKKGFFNRIFGGKKEEKLPEPEITPEELAEDVVEELPEQPVEELSEPVSEEPVIEEKHQTDLLDEEIKDATKKKKGFFEKIKERVVKFQLTEEKFEEIFWDFELALMENNVALEVIEKVKQDMHDQLTKENVTRKSVDQVILDTLKASLEEVLTVEQFNFLEKIQTKKPYVITMVGVNGSGKTTTLAKIIYLLQKNNLSVVVAASDTFRAAAIQQLEEHTTKLGVKLIKHDYNADPSAVAYDAISHAKAKDIDVVLIDTAGRLQSNSNLMDELKKLIRVNKPDLNIFIGESVTGNDCVEQAVAFNEAVGIDGIVLSKADIDEKGGAAISVSYVTKKPILYIGTGQTYDDLKPFNKDEILANLGL